MQPVSLLLGAALGLGILLAWKGFGILRDRSRTEAERRKGFWWLNGGLVLIAASAVAFSAGLR